MPKIFKQFLLATLQIFMHKTVYHMSLKLKTGIGIISKIIFGIIQPNIPHFVQCSAHVAMIHV